MDNKKERKTPKKFGMKYYYFLIYFALYAGAATNLIFALLYSIGKAYKGATLVHEVYPWIALIDSLYSFVLIALAIFAVYVRSALANYKKTAPKLIVLLHLLSGLGGLAYLIAVDEAANVDVGVGSVVVILVSVVRVIIDGIYLRRRASLFGR
ncbi:MAG: hypothetical protein E7637_05250 [Ruminococcaceae bacterium]|nr:hypothetical protein [Oscillospiraceae bacterium]